MGLQTCPSMRPLSSVISPTQKYFGMFTPDQKIPINITIFPISPWDSMNLMQKASTRTFVRPILGIDLIFVPWKMVIWIWQQKKKKDLKQNKGNSENPTRIAKKNRSGGIHVGLCRAETSSQKILMIGNLSAITGTNQ